MCIRMFANSESKENPMCKRLRLCLRFAVLCSMVPFLGTVSILPTFAADTADERVVSVAGYLSRSESDMLRPVTVITEEDIRLSGMKNIADLLRQTVYNSLGSYREQSGPAWHKMRLSISGPLDRI